MGMQANGGGDIVKGLLVPEFDVAECYTEGSTNADSPSSRPILPLETHNGIIPWYRYYSRLH